MNNYLQLSIDSIKLYNKNFENFLESNKSLIIENNIIEIETDEKIFRTLILESPQNILSNKLLSFKEEVMNTHNFFEEHDLAMAKNIFLEGIKIYRNPIANINIINNLAKNDIELHEFMLKISKNKNSIDEINNLQLENSRNELFITEIKLKNNKKIVNNNQSHFFIEKSQQINEFLGRVLKGVFNFLKGIGTNLLKAWDKLTAPLKVVFKFIGSFIGCITPVPSLRSSINQTDKIEDNKEKLSSTKKLLKRYFSLARKETTKTKSEQKKLKLEKPGKEKNENFRYSNKELLNEWSFKDILNPLKQLVEKVFSIKGFMELFAKVKNINFTSIWNFFTSKNKNLKKIETLKENYKTNKNLFEDYTLSAEDQAQLDREEAIAARKEANQAKKEQEKATGIAGLGAAISGAVAGSGGDLTKLTGNLIAGLTGWLLKTLLFIGPWGIAAGVVAMIGYFVWQKFKANPEAPVDPNAAVDKAENNVDENLENANLQLEDSDAAADTQTGDSGDLTDTDINSGVRPNDQNSQGQGQMITVPGNIMTSGQSITMPIQQFNQQLMTLSPQNENDTLRHLKFAVLRQSDDMLQKFVMKMTNEDMKQLDTFLDRFKGNDAIDKFFAYKGETNQTLKQSFMNLIYKGLPPGIIDALGLSGVKGVSSFNSAGKAGQVGKKIKDLKFKLEAVTNGIKVIAKDLLEKNILSRLKNFAKDNISDKKARKEFEKLNDEIKTKIIDDVFKKVLDSFAVKFKSNATTTSGTSYFEDDSGKFKVLKLLIEKKEKYDNLFKLKSIRNILLEADEPKDTNKDDYIELISDLMSTALGDIEFEDIIEDYIDTSLSDKVDTILEEDDDFDENKIEDFKKSLANELKGIVQSFWDFLESDKFANKYFAAAKSIAWS